MGIPTPQRPSLSGYVQPGKLLAWQWAADRLVRSPAYWIATRTAGYPSARPVWGIWREHHLWFSSGSAIARNIARDGRVQVNVESSHEVVLIEGIATGLAQRHVNDWVEAYREKYHWEMPATAEDVFEVRPVRALAWICDNSGLDGGVQFSNSATQWTFEMTEDGHAEH
ncbi:MAG: hypothetical protein HC809_05035 [Gammaproteobacteria bacterium]|nr:hypothetical protein [Gammaproteobacteria bacterium]